MIKTFDIVAPGKPIPLGCYSRNHGVQFSLFSKNAESVKLHFFRTEDSGIPEHTFELDSKLNKTGDIWHIWVKGVEDGQLYGYTLDGEYNPAKGHRFNENILLVDPYAKAITNNYSWHNEFAFGYDFSSKKKDLSPSPRKNFPTAVKSIACLKNGFDWEQQRPLNLPMQDLIIYETHVKGLTGHKSAKVKASGSFLGVVEKIPYLKELGITALELLPVQEFNKSENTRNNPLTEEPLVNYWGYSTTNFFAPAGCYTSSEVAGDNIKEFKTMVRELHKAGIEVILDVVFNHTAEGNEQGPTFSFRGLDNSVYYMLEKDKRYYKNYSGCGNTVNCNHPFVREFILDCLRYWVIEMHVDGFRFDLASILGRDQEGNVMDNPPLVERIAGDPILGSTKIIAEAWDAGGAYQVGSFPGQRWAEWNGHYRDDIREFWRGDMGMAGTLATRLTGSSDLYGDDGRSPLHSINFITCHDGFTLRDLVSYEDKHNEANGEQNNDGDNNNCSVNFGVEGETRKKNVLALREKMTKNFLATILLSQGIPMLLGGDEFGRTQKGNNNAYCQDNEISWYDWSLLKKHQDLFRFTKELIAFRKRYDILRRERFFFEHEGKTKGSREITWHGVEPFKPCWDAYVRTLALVLHAHEKNECRQDIYLAFNSWVEPITFKLPLPKIPGTKWYRVIDTSLSPGDDIHPSGNEVLLPNQTQYKVAPQSLVALISR